jgi:hypothetical protein
MNYSLNTWSATLNGRSVVTGEPITQTSETMDFGDADAVWIYSDPYYSGNNYMMFGNYSVTAGP